jgi:hypothetical protein
LEVGADRCKLDAVARGQAREPCIRRQRDLVTARRESRRERRKWLDVAGATSGQQHDASH